MADVRLKVGRPDGRQETQNIRLAGPDADFVLDKDRIEASVLATLPGHLFDLLDIVAAVFATDGRIKRGGDTRPALGQHWRRDLGLTIPVGDPEFWNDPKRLRRLTDCLGFLTEDDWSFSFVRRAGTSATAAFLDLDPTGAAFAADEVILFSGGLDSLAGALQVLATTDRKVVLVTYRSAQKAITRQVRLGKELTELYPGRVLHLHVRATNIGSQARERTQRSRSFLFAGLGFVVARLFGASLLSFYENGVVSHQLPISPQVIGTMATRTTHPQSLRLMGDLLEAVEPGWGQLRNDFEWLTKTEVVQTLDRRGGAELICKSVSCTSLREETTLHRHCGACSQCLDRRFAVLAAGLAGADPEESYAQDVLTGASATDQKLTMSLDWTRHGWGLAEMSPVDFLGRFGSEIRRIAQGHLNLDPAEVLRRSHDLQKRHGRSVQRVIEALMTTQAEALLRQTLPDTCLLRRFVGERTAGEMVLRGTASPLRPESGPETIEQGAEDDRLTVRFFKSDGRHGIEVSGLGAVHDRPAEVAHGLLPAFDEDRAAGRAPEAHRYLSPGRILSLRKNAVTQYVKRCRDQLADYHEAIHGSPPEAPLLIQTKKPKGYRLDPTIHVSDRS